MRPLALSALALLAACGGESAPLLGPDAGASPDASAPDAGASSDASADAGDLEVDAGVALGPDEVAIDDGVLRGEEANGVWSFKGVPYVAPPVGARRFAPPAPHPGWSGVRDADAFGPICPQVDRRGQLAGDEDCLTLNVWTARAEAPRPVMVWIHGGGHVQGAGSLAFYDGTDLVADGDVVVVTINYRLGALGFLALDALRDDAASGEGVNFGMLDQLAALEWVQRNIRAFGGDPDQVTIFGESAGAVSVASLMGAPAAAGLFHRAAAQSGGGGYSLADWTRATEVGAQVVAELGCDVAADVKACLRAADARDVVEAQGATTTSAFGLPDFGPVLDGTILDQQPWDTLADGGGHAVPLVVGSNADEAVAAVAAIPVRTRAAFERVVESYLGPLAAQVVPLYPEADFPDHKDAFEAVYGDIAFNCRAEGLAHLLASRGAPAYHYAFEHTLSGAAGAQGSQHGHEIPFVFGTVDAFPGYTPSVDDLTVSTAMVRAWATFAHGGAPEVTPAWPPYVRGEPTIMVFDAPLAVTSSFRNGRCERLRELGLVR